MLSNLINSHGQAVQVLHALKHYGTSQEQAILTPEVEAIVKDICFQQKEMLVPATNNLIEAFLEVYGEFSPNIMTAILEILNPGARPLSAEAS